MKITIYVKRDSMEHLEGFLSNGQDRVIYWHHARRTPKDVEVTISYDDYMILKDFKDE